MFGLGNKKPEAKAQREAENVLADLRIELQDADINLINLNNNRNAVLEKIAYFEEKLKTVSVTAENNTTLVTKSSDQAEVAAA